MIVKRSLLIAPTLWVAAAGIARASSASDGPASASAQAAKIQYLDMMQRYLTLMQSVTKLAEDPTAAALAATFASKELIVGEGGEAKAIEFYEKILPEAKNEAVQRAIRMMLADLYARTGQKTKAMEQFRILIVTAPPSPIAATSASDAASAPGPQPARP